MVLTRTHIQHNTQHIQTDDPSSSWGKTLRYYALHISIAAAIGFAITGSWAIALAVSLLEPATQVLAWLMQRWAQHSQAQSTRHSVTQRKHHAVQRYLARYARAA